MGFPTIFDGLVEKFSDDGNIPIFDGPNNFGPSILGSSPLGRGHRPTQLKAVPEQGNGRRLYFTKLK